VTSMSLSSRSDSSSSSTSLMAAGSNTPASSSRKEKLDRPWNVFFSSLLPSRVRRMPTLSPSFHSPSLSCNKTEQKCENDSDSKATYILPATFAHASVLVLKLASVLWTAIRLIQQKEANVGSFLESRDQVNRCGTTRTDLPHYRSWRPRSNPGHIVLSAIQFTSSVGGSSLKKVQSLWSIVVYKVGHRIWEIFSATVT
jgi:hypothetical protein